MPRCRQCEKAPAAPGLGWCRACVDEEDQRRAALGARHRRPGEEDALMAKYGLPHVGESSAEWYTRVKALDEAAA
jgi:hypothetical protein